MNKRLEIQLFVQPNCKLVAIDNSDYDSINVDLIKHIMLEFLSYNEDSVHLCEKVRLKQDIHEQMQKTSTFLLDVDGTYYYYKLVIPVLNHFETSNKKYSKLHNELFFYENCLYKSNLPDTEDEFDISEILNNSKQITNYIEAYELVQKGCASQTFYCPKEIVFSNCKLQKCLVYLQKQLLFNNCNCQFDECNTDETLRNRRDFLLSALFVLDYLIKTNNFIEAQRIIDNLSTCNSICGDELDTLNKGCSCGNSI